MRWWKELVVNEVSSIAIAVGEVWLELNGECDGHAGQVCSGDVRKRVCEERVVEHRQCIGREGDGLIV